jgi:hypothetical protein
VILAFVGLKMIIAEWYHIDTFVSLGVIALVLTVSIWLSMRREAREDAARARAVAAGSGGRREAASSEAAGSEADGNSADGLEPGRSHRAEATRKPG